MKRDKYITKKLIKDICTFLNTFIDFPNVIFSYTVYCTFINVSANVWELQDNGYVNSVVRTCSYNIRNEKEFNEIKDKIIESVKIGLEQLKEN